MPSTATDHASERLAFQPLYHADRLRYVNPHGDIGLITLWSPWTAVERKLQAISPDLLDPERSRIAVIANLYGDGMFAMFCNLLYNPQVRHLIALGSDLDLPTCAEIEAFLEAGLEDTTVLGAPLQRIRGSARTFPSVAEFDAERLRETLTFHALGKLSAATLPEELLTLLRELQRAADEELPERVQVGLPGALPDDYAYLPSQVGGHQVIRRSPLEAWEDLVTRTVRFGHPVTIKSGQRLELLNAKVVITEPAHDPEHALRARGFELSAFLAYQRKMFEPELQEEDADYSYGNRLRGYFPQGEDGLTDTLQTTIDGLRENPESRDAYISLWDSAYDLPGSHSNPCLTTLFFRRSEERLTLTATYRAHNLLTAWLLNVYGLIAIQRYVCERVDMPVGALTVVSHSLGADPSSDRYPAAIELARLRTTDDDVDTGSNKHSLRADPSGYFIVSQDGDSIVAEHRYEGVLIKQYRSDRAATIAHQVSADMAVSLVSHALWLGRELATNERALRAAREGNQ